MNRAHEEGRVLLFAHGEDRPRTSLDASEWGINKHEQAE